MLLQNNSKMKLHSSSRKSTGYLSNSQYPPHNEYNLFNGEIINNTNFPSSLKSFHTYPHHHRLIETTPTTPTHSNNIIVHNYRSIKLSLKSLSLHFVTIASPSCTTLATSLQSSKYSHNNSGVWKTAKNVSFLLLLSLLLTLNVVSAAGE